MSKNNWEIYGKITRKISQNIVNRLVIIMFDLLWNTYNEEEWDSILDDFSDKKLTELFGEYFI